MVLFCSVTVPVGAYRGWEVNRILDFSVGNRTDKS
jgi:hypothetical protein